MLLTGFNSTLNRIPHGELLSTSYINRGQSKYNIGNVSEALEDFKKVEYESLRARKYNNIAICYYSLGLYEDAETEFRNAIKADPKLIHAYYNLAVLYNSENQNDKAKRLLKICLKLNPKFKKAREALKNIESSGEADWFSWWFTSNYQKKIFGILLIIMITFVTFFIIFASSIEGVLPIWNLKIKSLSAASIASSTIIIAIFVVILLLPSLKKSQGR